MTARRDILIAAVLVAAAPRAMAQADSRSRRVVFLSNSSRPSDLEHDRIYGFALGMAQLGYRDGQNLTIEWRFADDDPNRLQALAAQIAASVPDAVVTIGSSATAAIAKASRTIPIVMGTSADPVGAGLVASLARPGGNVTGLSNLSGDLSAKHVEILRSLVPGLTRIAVLANSRMITHGKMFDRLATEAGGKGISTVRAEASSRDELIRAFDLVGRERASALVVLIAPLFTEQRSQIANLALERKLPSIASIWQFADSGGLVAYGPDLSENFRHAASYVDRIFKGARPGDLPVEEPTKYELVVNRRTAKALALSIPPDIELRADRLIT